MWPVERVIVYSNMAAVVPPETGAPRIPLRVFR
jgi:hypothetical protein